MQYNWWSCLGKLIFHKNYINFYKIPIEMCVYIVYTKCALSIKYWTTISPWLIISQNLYDFPLRHWKRIFFAPHWALSLPYHWQTEILQIFHVVPLTHEHLDLRIVFVFLFCFLSLSLTFPSPFSLLLSQISHSFVSFNQNS